MLAYGVPRIGRQPNARDRRRFGSNGVGWRSGPKTRTRRRWKKIERRNVIVWMWQNAQEGNLYGQ